VVRVSQQSPNGVLAIEAPAATPSKLTAPRIERWVDVPDYPGYQVKLWINYPRALRTTLTAEDLAGAEELEGEELEAYAAELKAKLEGVLAAIVLEHNGWPDQEGNVLPQPSTAGFWELVPDQHLANIVMTLAREAPAQLPNSRPSTRPR
jgi:hypothetical protein